MLLPSSLQLIPPQQTSGSGGNSSHSQPQNQNSSPQNSGQYPNQKSKLQLKW